MPLLNVDAIELNGNYLRLKSYWTFSFFNDLPRRSILSSETKKLDFNIDYWGFQKIANFSWSDESNFSTYKGTFKPANIKPGVLKLFCIAALKICFQNFATLKLFFAPIGVLSFAPPPPSSFALISQCGGLNRVKKLARSRPRRVLTCISGLLTPMLKQI